MACAWEVVDDKNGLVEVLGRATGLATVPWFGFGTESVGGLLKLPIKFLLAPLFPTGELSRFCDGEFGGEFTVNGN